MNAIEKLMLQARQAPAKIVLPESSDARILAAAAHAAKQGIARPVLLLSADEKNRLSQEHGIDLSAVAQVDPWDAESRTRWATALYQLRAHKGMSEEAALEAVNSPLTVAALMCQLDEVDAVVAGAVFATADVVRTALQIVGVRPDTAVVSSFMLMVPPEGRAGTPGAVVFSDCGLVIDPNSEQLREIARAAGLSAQGMLGVAPRVAMLSFSTAGSAQHAEVDKVRAATAGLKLQEPTWQIMGEVQFDAAWVPELLAHKAPDAHFEGPANVFVFPSLAAANIGYKIAERLGGWQAIGPFMQGLNRPVNDLSRGCVVDDVVALMAGTSAQVAAEAAR